MIEEITAHLESLRVRRPLVQNITNYVSMDITANVLLAIGCSPAMVHARPEAAEFAAIADSLVINIGTLSDPWLESMLAASRAAREAKKPWALDPVAVGATRYRDHAAAQLLNHGPAVVRGNASEVLALAGTGARPKGVDSANAAGDAVEAARHLAAVAQTVCAVSGAIDYVTDGKRTIAIETGDPLMASVTATGCSATALIGAFLAVTDDPFAAAAAGLAVFGAAGKLAAKTARAPGSFRTALIDALYLMDAPTLAANCRIQDMEQ